MRKEAFGHNLNGMLDHSGVINVLGCHAGGPSLPVALSAYTRQSCLTMLASSNKSFSRPCRQPSQSSGPMAYVDSNA